jgi:hypothetical protein
MAWECRFVQHIQHIQPKNEVGKKIPEKCRRFPNFSVTLQKRLDMLDMLDLPACRANSCTG